MHFCNKNVFEEIEDSELVQFNTNSITISWLTILTYLSMYIIFIYLMQK